MKHAQPLSLNGRRWLVLTCLLMAGAGLAWRAVYLQTDNTDFLQQEGNDRHQRTLELAAHRGIVYDRNGEPLAVSTPVDSVVVDPRLYLLRVAPSDSEKLARLLELNPKEMMKRIQARDDRGFLYLRRHVSPELAARVKALALDGISLEREYRRFYPEGEVASHIVGLTNIDDEGQEGLELALDDMLRGEKGLVQVRKDNRGRVVEGVRRVREPEPGEDVTLSIDKRLQYLAYRELKVAVQTHQAVSASAVLLDARSGEVLAMVNQPSYNPNNRSSLTPGAARNRATTDVFEPGSTMKPFTIAAALEAGTISARTVVDTSPGYMRVGGNTIRDALNYGQMDVTAILQKSSNVGTSKIALSLSPEQQWKTYAAFGFGMSSQSGFPGEADGAIGDYWLWKDSQQVSRSYGYGLSVSALQLARAYTVFGNDGRLLPVSFRKLDQMPEGDRVLSAKVAQQVRTMLESVMADEGTGTAARVGGYRIAGKTGTAHKVARGGYAEDRYSALFAGLAPASDPRLVLVVVVHDPRLGEYHGGKVAAPVFSRIMSGALRLMNVAPDDVKDSQQILAGLKGGTFHVARGGAQ